MLAEEKAKTVRPYRILIADDDPSMLEALADAIGDEPSLQLVGAAATVSAALELARLHHPDVAVVDVRMPDGGGQRIAAELTKGSRPVRVLAMSGSDGESVLGMLQAGAQSYISKAETDLVDLIVRFCRGNVILSSAEALTELVAGNDEFVKQTTALRKAARAAHGEYLRRLRSIFDSALDAVVTMDAEGKITDWNPMAENIFGWPRSEVVGRLMSDTIIPERYREAHRRGLQHFLKTGEGPVLNKRLELEGLHRDGHEFPIEISIAATRSGSGFVFGAFLRDITERRQAEDAVRQLASILNATGDPIMATDLKGIVISWNPAAERVYGYKSEEIIGRPASLIIPPERSREFENLERVKRGEPMQEFETVRRRKDGGLLDVSVNIAPLKDTNGRMIAVIGIHRDISSAKRSEQALRASEARYRQIVESAFEGIWLIDTRDRTSFLNRRMADMLGYTVEEMMGRPVSDFMDADAQRQFAANMERRRAGFLPHDVRFRRKDGGVIITSLEASPSYDEAGNYTGSLAMVTDITARSQAEDALRYQAFHDALTGLPNRLLLAERVAQALEVAGASGHPASLLMLDLDHFKEVNETFGHQAGDGLLQQMGPRLKQQLGESDLLARFAGDQFAVLLPDTDRAKATTMAAKVLDSLDRPFEIVGQLFDLAASIGVATFPLDADSVDSLLRRAEIALFVAKRSRGVFVSYAAEYEKHGASRLTMMAELRLAIQEQQLLLHYQPLVSLRDRSLSGVEALVRWHHPERGMVPPNEFIPFAEKTRLIQPLTRWVLTTALRQCRAWHDAGRTIPMAVNIAMRDLVDPHFPDLIGTLLRDANVQPEWLRLEITEGVIMAEPERAIEILGRLRKLGVRLAIDDFGTGYSSLAYLHRLPVDEIKIDKSFVSKMAGATSRANIVRASVDLGHSLRLESVAEGVEDARTWDLLAALGCDTAQGYFMSRPVPSEELLPWLHRWESSERGDRRAASDAAA
jgi:diguanylate cyclase (GGDEF)-like protein/PAS domain S-box-containing protein